MEDGSVRVCVVDDYDVVVAGTAALLVPHEELVTVVEATTQDGPQHQVDVALLDCFALPDHGALVLAALSANANVGAVAVYAWNAAPALVDAAFASGARGFISKGLDGRALAEAIVAVHEGADVVARVGEDGATGGPVAGGTRRWPGDDIGLTERESEVLALITQGKRTSEVASALYIGVNSVKTHTQKVFRKIGVTTRTEAALWGVDHGFRPDRSSHDLWGGGGGG